MKKILLTLCILFTTASQLQAQTFTIENKLNRPVKLTTIHPPLQPHQTNLEALSTRKIVTHNKTKRTFIVQAKGFQRATINTGIKNDNINLIISSNGNRLIIQRKNAYNKYPYGDWASQTRSPQPQRP